MVILVQTLVVCGTGRASPVFGSVQKQVPGLFFRTPMLKVRRFKRRIAVHRGEAVYYTAPAAVMHLLDSGLATIRAKTGKLISAINLTGEASGYEQGQAELDQLGLRPGSFGIRTEYLDSGYRCYQHRNAWDGVIPKCDAASA